MTRPDQQIETTFEIVTPENIAFHYGVAGPFRRLPAYVIDVVLRTMFIVGVTIALRVAGVVLGGISIAILFIVMFVVEWFSGGLFETFMNGQTPGKWLCGIRAVSADGQPLNGMQAILRNFFRLADLFPLVSIQVFNTLARVLMGETLPPWYIFPTCLLGLVAMALNGRYQRIGDLVANTIVVIEERKWFSGMAALDDPRAVQLAGHLPADLRISRTMAQAIANYVERRKFFTIPRRREIARHLGVPLLKKYQLPPDTSHDLLLCAIYYRAFIADQKDDERRAAQWGQRPFGQSTSPASQTPTATEAALPESPLPATLVPESETSTETAR